MADLMGKTKAEVEAELGLPHLVTQWDSAAPPQEATAAQLRRYRQNELHSIWVYPGRVISFNLEDKVKQVDTNSDLYLPPERPPVA